MVPRDYSINNPDSKGNEGKTMKISKNFSIHSFQNISTIKLLILFQGCLDKQNDSQTHLDEGL